MNQLNPVRLLPLRGAMTIAYLLAFPITCPAAPNQSVSPANLSVTVNEDQTVQKSLTLSNGGGSSVAYSVLASSWQLTSATSPGTVAQMSDEVLHDDFESGSISQWVLTGTNVFNVVNGVAATGSRSLHDVETVQSPWMHILRRNYTTTQTRNVFFNVRLASTTSEAGCFDLLGTTVSPSGTALISFRAGSNGK